MPEPNQQPISFNDILQLHAYLSNLTSPSEAMKEAITKLETHITIYVNSLKTAISNQRPN
jgi:hypothetical protein